MVVMRGPDGKDMHLPGVYLEVVPGKKLVATNAFTTAWEPTPKTEMPLITIILTFDADSDGKTAYTARVKHWTMEERDQHERMGFHQGWGICTDQLEALAKTL